MPDFNKKFMKCCHSTSLFQLINSLSYCMICSCFIFKNNSSNDTQVISIKPDNFVINNEFQPFLLWTIEEKNNCNSFINKKDYLKQRSPIIKNIKKVCSYFSLSLKTYFLAIEYFDKICSNISNFNPKTLFQISIFCLILATKYNEKTSTATHVQNALKKDISKNYTVDEIYVLQLLNYDLNIYTSYDILIDIMHCGFIFNGENFNYKKLNYIYYYLEKMLYIFSEINTYIDLTSKQIALSVVGFARELLDLKPFSDTIKSIFLINQMNEEYYISGLNMIKKRIKIEGEITSKKNEKNCNKKKTKREEKNIAIYCNEYKKVV